MLVTRLKSTLAPRTRAWCPSACRAWACHAWACRGALGAVCNTARISLAGHCNTQRVTSARQVWTHPDHACGSRCVAADEAPRALHVTTVSGRRPPHDTHPGDAPGAWQTGHELGCARQSSGSTAVDTQEQQSQSGAFEHRHIRPAASTARTCSVASSSITSAPNGLGAGEGAPSIALLASRRAGFACRHHPPERHPSQRTGGHARACVSEQGERRV